MFKILDVNYDVDFGGLLVTAEIDGVKHTLGQQCKGYIVEKDCWSYYDDYTNNEIPCECELFENIIRAAAKMAKINLKRENDILGGVGYEDY